MPKVSVIVPVYNTERYLRRCMDSICNQTLKDIEIICVNDCSPDNSLAVLEEYAEKDNRIRVISFSENKGVSVARNMGISVATGEYIGFVDSDDFVDLDFYEKLYDATGDGIDIVKGNIRSCGGNAHVIDLVLSRNNVDIQRNKSNFIYYFWSAIFNRNLIIDYNVYFPEGLIDFEDPCFTIKAVIFSNGVCVVNQAFYYYGNNPTSVTRTHLNTSGKLECLKKGLDYILDLLDTVNVDSIHYVAVFVRLVENIESKIADRRNYSNYSHTLFDYRRHIWQRCRYSEECSKAYAHERAAYRKALVAGLRSKIMNCKCVDNSSDTEENL